MERSDQQSTAGGRRQDVVVKASVRASKRSMASAWGHLGSKDRVMGLQPYLSHSRARRRSHCVLDGPVLRARGARGGGGGGGIE